MFQVQFNSFQILQILYFITIQYSYDNETINANPLLGNLTQTYNQTWIVDQVGNYSLYGPISGLYGINQTTAYINMYDDESNDTNSNRTITSLVQIYDSGYYDASYMLVYLTGMYYPEVKRGIMQGKIYYRGYYPSFEIPEQMYIDYLMNTAEQWPPQDFLVTEDQARIFEINQPSADQCDFYYFFTFTNQTIDQKQNKYLIDFQSQFSEYSLVDNETLSGALTGYLLSYGCATEFQLNGPIYNTALQNKQEAVYTSVFIILQILALISGARFRVMSTAPQRIARLSLASFLLQTGFDFIIGTLYQQFAIVMYGLKMPLMALGILSYIYALFVDLTMIQVILIHDAQVRQRRHNICTWFIIIFIIMIIFVLVQQFLPNWTYFILIILLSSYWIIQSIFSFVNNIDGPALPFDYIAINYLIKCAPIVYFYGYSGNFMKFNVEDWYIYVIIVWFSIQLIIQILQYFFGNRLGIKKQTEYVNIDQQQGYSYDQQCLTTVGLNMIDILNKQQVEQLIQEQKGSELYPLPYKLNVEQTEQQNNEQQIVCMNPLHQHSVFYNKDYGIYDLIQMYPILNDRKNVLLKLQPEQTKCFGVINIKDLDNSFECPICLDEIQLTQVENKTILCISKDKLNNDEQYVNQDAYNQELSLLQKLYPSKKDYGVWITPCGHVFHSQCLCKWGQENLSCPVDRQKIPPMKKYNWYE